MVDQEPQPLLAEFLRAACLKELERALSLLSDVHGDRNGAVHESRKSVRRVRAWLRLGDRHRRKALAPIDAQLRLLRRTIGPLRDGASRIVALDRLRKRRDMVRMRGPLAAARKADRRAGASLAATTPTWRRLAAAAEGTGRPVVLPAWLAARRTLRG